jgi:RND superfamily putative drug exporter
MELMGRWNWYLPSWLSWLPELKVDVERQPVREEVAAGAD